MLYLVPNHQLASGTPFHARLQHCTMLMIPGRQPLGAYPVPVLSACLPASCKPKATCFNEQRHQDALQLRSCTKIATCVQDAPPGTLQWLLLTAHHILVDERSMNILLKELGSLYMAKLQGRPPDLAPCQVQYPDFAHWQRHQLETGKIGEQISFWKQHLQGAPARLELPPDLARPPCFSGRGATVPYQLGAEETDALRAFTRKHKASLLETILAAVQVRLTSTGFIMQATAQQGSTAPASLTGIWVIWVNACLCEAHAA